MKYLVLLTFALPWLSFEQVTTSTSLTGKWVEVTTRTDTLTFETVDTKCYLILGRATKSCYGLYSYNLQSENKISLFWSYSSIDGAKEYYFKQSGDFIEIEEFYCMKVGGKKLTFKRLK